MGQFCNLRLKLPLVSETVRDRPIGSHVVSVSGVKFFWWMDRRELHSCGVDCGVVRMTKFGMATQVLEERVSKGSATPPIPRNGPKCPQIFGTLPTPKRLDLEQRNLV